MKIYFSILLALIQIFSPLSPDKSKLPESEIINIKDIPSLNSSTELSSPDIKAISAIVYDCKTNEILYTKNADEKIAPASLTKLLTALTALQYVSADTEFTIGNEIGMIHSDSSSCHLKVGQKIQLKTLLYGLLLPSGCDAAYAVAVNVVKEINTISNMNNEKALDFFVYLMNKQAKKIGMKNSNFKSPDGYDEDSQYITAYDMLKLTVAALNNPVIREIVGTYSKTAYYNSGDAVVWENTNNFLNPDSQYYNPNIYGVKTGSSAKAGMSVACAYKDDNSSIITVVLGCESFWDRYMETEKLISWVNQQS